MIKVITRAKNNRLQYIFGLSAMNLVKLKEGLPIHFALEPLGGHGDILIFSGETEAIMCEELLALLGPESIVVDTRRGAAPSKTSDG
jgi:hypothetical protein